MHKYVRIPTYRNGRTCGIENRPSENTITRGRHKSVTRNFIFPARVDITLQGGCGKPLVRGVCVCVWAGERFITDRGRMGSDIVIIIIIIGRVEVKSRYCEWSLLPL